jgi:hypothetical protein
VKMQCICGDIYCHSCGPAQGNYHCSNCGKWTDEGGCEDVNFCNAKMQEYEEEMYKAWKQEQEFHIAQGAKERWW